MAKAAYTNVVQTGEALNSAAILVKNNPYVRKMARQEL
jgi:hypothetical protein